VTAVRSDTLLAAEAALPSTPELGDEALTLCEQLFPLSRSLTGDGVRETFRLLGGVLDFDVTEVRSGTPVLDWVVPDEWSCGAAWIADAAGRRIVDASESTLHVLGYSEGVEARLRGSELQEHLHSLPAHPEWIPARTSYWERRWGFCVTDEIRRTIDDDAVYEVRIDASHESGSLTYAEALLPGQLEDEILVSTYSCHPSLANDGTSGLAVAALLGKYLRDAGLRHTVRILLAPATIGAITWLARNEDRLGRVCAGLIVSCVGDPAPLRYKRSRRDSALVDRAAALVLAQRGGTTYPFEPWGGDERHFCSPGFDLPVGHLTRSAHGTYPEYHTSADDLSLLDARALAGAVAAAAAIIGTIDVDRRPRNECPKGEPQLGARGLYPTLGAGVPGGAEAQLQARLWVLNLADGTHTLVGMAERSGLPFELIAAAADELSAAGLLSDTDKENP
jgi:aminopeptidase-like protein